MTDRFAFSIAATDGAARTGVIRMQRGEIRTPAFMPVGTAATVKAMAALGWEADIADPPCGEAMGRWQPAGLTEGLWREVAAPPPSPAATVPLPIASRQGGSSELPVGYAAQPKLLFPHAPKQLHIAAGRLNRRRIDRLESRQG